MNMSRTLTAFAIALLAYCTPNAALAAAYGSGWHRELQLTVGYEDNLPRAYRSIDVANDVVTSMRLGIGYTTKAGDNLHYDIGGYVGYTHHDQFGALDKASASLSAGVSWQPGVDFTAPWYRLSADITRFDYDGARAREGTLFTADASINKRLAMRAIGRLGYRYLDYRADDNIVFDRRRHEMFAGLDFQLSSQLWLSTSYAFQRGDFTASGSIAAGSVPSDAGMDDPAFQACTREGCMPWWAYRSDTDIHAADVALVFPVMGFDTDLTLRYVDASSDNGLDYEDWTLTYGVILTF